MIGGSVMMTHDDTSSLDTVENIDRQPTCQLDYSCRKIKDIQTVFAFLYELIDETVNIPYCLAKMKR